MLVYYMSKQSYNKKYDFNDDVQVTDPFIKAQSMCQCFDSINWFSASISNSVLSFSL